MPIYQFNSFSGERRIDTRDVELDDVSQARAVALRFFAGDVSGLARHDPACDHLRVEVTDEAGRALFTVKLTVTESGE